MNRRRAILEAMRDRVRGALPDAKVFVGREPRLGPDDPPVAVSILPDEDIPDDALPRSRRLWTIRVLVARVAGPDDDAWLEFESALFEPVMTAIEDTRASPSQVRGTPGSTLGGLCTALVRESVTAYERTEGTYAEGVEIAYSLAYPVSPGTT